MLDDRYARKSIDSVNEWIFEYSCNFDLNQFDFNLNLTLSRVFALDRPRGGGGAVAAASEWLGQSSRKCRSEQVDLEAGLSGSFTFWGEFDWFF